jgi:serine/threonine protein phosphatase PrpC
MPTPFSPRVYLESCLSEAESLDVPRGAAAVYSRTSPIKTTVNEDAVAFFPIDATRAVLVVADGLGGHAAGAKASATAIQMLQQSIESAITESEPDLRAAILDGMEQANRAIIDLGTGAATTMSVAEVDGNEVRSYHVGDSVVLVFGQRGKLKFQTVAHSPVGFAVEAGLMNEKEAMHHEHRHIVSNVIGSPDMRIEIGSSLKITARDTILVASDGLADNLRVGQIVQRLCKGRLLPAAKKLASDVFERMTHPREGEPSKSDDMSFIAYRPGLVPTNT